MIDEKTRRKLIVVGAIAGIVVLFDVVLAIAGFTGTMDMIPFGWGMIFGAVLMADNSLWRKRKK